MPKSNFIIAILVIMAVIIIGVLLSTDKNKYSTTNELKVAATTFPIYDITRNVTGDKVKVISIVPSGASPHTYEVTPEQVKELWDTKIVFKIGQGVDDWTDDLSSSISKIQIVTLDNNVSFKKFEENKDKEKDKHSHGEYDPHYWLSINNAKIIAHNIADELTKLDPNNADYYQKNLEQYKEKLSELKKSAVEKLKELKNRKLVTTHNAWSYFADEFDLEIVGTFQPSPGQEPTPQQLTELQNLISENNVKALFSEPQLSNEIIKPFADDTGLNVYILDPLGGINNRQSYIELIKYNVDTIYNALK